MNDLQRLSQSELRRMKEHPDGLTRAELQAVVEELNRRFVFQKQSASHNLYTETP